MSLGYGVLLVDPDWHTYSALQAAAARPADASVAVAGSARGAGQQYLPAGQAAQAEVAGVAPAAAVF